MHNAGVVTRCAGGYHPFRFMEMTWKFELWKQSPINDHYFTFALVPTILSCLFSALRRSNSMDNSSRSSTLKSHEEFRVADSDLDVMEENRPWSCRHQVVSLLLIQVSFAFRFLLDDAQKANLLNVWHGYYNVVKCNTNANRVRAPPELVNPDGI